MVILFVKHKISAYSAWRKVYDEHKAFRIRSGMLSEQVYRSTSDPSEIFMFFKWDNIFNAKLFSQSEDLKKAMQKAGVMSKPEVHFLQEAETLTSERQILQPMLEDDI